MAGQTGLEISSARYESNIKNDSVYIPKIGIITKSKDSKDQKDQSSLKQYPSPTPNYGTIVLEEHFSFKDIKAKADEEYEELEDDDEIPKRNIVVTLWKLYSLKRILLTQLDLSNLLDGKRRNGTIKSILSAWRQFGFS